ncbi:family 43 glycosylhydrolase [Tenggerimyces flavus]|uniref:Family 43 glycosylhydrolase n=1 Tax=Tenggerimyces flavus TaxID=1708749 RepID=A0ABV7YLA3_9ACTN|nr:family 43 glycosylhydrolase [Tenggerimyces flavus]MBM7784861.1 GH43 family beta-xylosidase [Tenggerimyces flavus]
MHFLNGRFYVYYTATNAGDGHVPNHRMYVLESAGADPLGPYTYKGPLAAAADHYSIDGTVMRMPDGSLYAIWSGWDPGTTGPQNMYIAPMSNPWTTSGPRVLLSTPTYDWEKDHAPVNEGAVAAVPRRAAVPDLLGERVLEPELRAWGCWCLHDGAQQRLHLAGRHGDVDGVPRGREPGWELWR